MISHTNSYGNFQFAGLTNNLIFILQSTLALRLGTVVRHIDGCNVWYSYVKNIVNGGDYNETVFIKANGNATPATPEEIISLSKRKYGVDNETSEVAYTDNQWSVYLNLCKEYWQDISATTL